MLFRNNCLYNVYEDPKTRYGRYRDLEQLVALHPARSLPVMETILPWSIKLRSRVL